MGFVKFAHSVCESFGALPRNLQEYKLYQPATPNFSKTTSMVMWYHENAKSACLFTWLRMV